MPVMKVCQGERPMLNDETLRNRAERGLLDAVTGLTPKCDESHLPGLRETRYLLPMNIDTETQSQIHGRGHRLLLALALSLFPHALHAQPSPYFIVYDHHMEEPGNLEVSLSPVLTTPKAGARSVASNLEIEYGANGWWTTSLYLDGAADAGTTAAFTGYRLENRFRLLMDEHVVNPVLYLEFADTSGADRIAKEIVGFDSWRDSAEPVAAVRHEKSREVEAKLILSSYSRGWNFATNAIAEKNLAGSPWDFGYAIGTSRPLALAAQPGRCWWCRENFTAGVELYGGLGEQSQVTLARTSHYIAPAIAWSLPNGVTLRFSPSWGLTSDSNRSFMRFGVSYEGRIR